MHIVTERIAPAPRQARAPTSYAALIRNPDRAALTSTGTDNSAGRERHVLVIDDDAGIRRMLGRLLHLHGFTALEATSIAEAMASAERHYLRAIILDLHLGEQSGLDLLATLRRNPRCAAIPVLILTGQTMLREEDVALISRSHAHVFYKPLPLNTLVEHVGRLARADDRT